MRKAQEHQRLSYLPYWSCWPTLELPKSRCLIMINNSLINPYFLAFFYLQLNTSLLRQWMFVPRGGCFIIFGYKRTGSCLITKFLALKKKSYPLIIFIFPLSISLIFISSLTWKPAMLLLKSQCYLITPLRFLNRLRVPSWPPDVPYLFICSVSSLWLSTEQIQAYSGDIAGSVPDYCNKVGVAINWVIIFLLVEGLAFNL